MTNAVVIVLMIIYAILYNVVYNALFIDIFSSHWDHFMQRAVATFFAAAILTGITLVLWWIPFLIFLGIAAYAFFGKKNAGLAVVLVILAICIAVAGINTSRQNDEENTQAQQETIETLYERAA